MSEYLSLPEAARRIHTTSGRPPSTETLWRWCVKGFNSPTGESIKLAHLRFGSRICVTETALQEFAEQCAAAHEAATSSTTKTATPTRRKRRATSNDDPERQAQIEAATARVMARKGGAR